MRQSPSGWERKDGASFVCNGLSENVHMAGHSLIEQIREGMVMQTTDGVQKITQIWCGSEPVNSSTACGDESCLEVQGASLHSLEHGRGRIRKRCDLACG
jgi:hypothetical protein